MVFSYRLVSLVSVVHVPSRVNFRSDSRVLSCNRHSLTRNENNGLGPLGDCVPGSGVRVQG